MAAMPFRTFWSSSPTCRSDRGRRPSWYVEQGAGRRLRVRQLHSRLHRSASRIGRSASRRPAVPIIGDDIKSQVGATSMHRTLARLFLERGVRSRAHEPAERRRRHWTSYNMLERERLESKKISKTNAVTSGCSTTSCPADDVYIGPSGLRAVAQGPQVGAHPHRRGSRSAARRSTWS